MYLYKITNKISGSLYIGITRVSIKARYNCHKNSAKRGTKTPLYDAIRFYGIDNFDIELVEEFEDTKQLEQAEFNMIKELREKGYKLYNLLDGGTSYFNIKDKESWKVKLKEKRKGRQPALGMKHTEENKEFFSVECTRRRIEKYGCYNSEEIVKYSFKEAKKLFNVSKTHYYRLLKRAKLNELC